MMLVGWNPGNCLARGGGAARAELGGVGRVVGFNGFYVFDVFDVFNL